MWPVEEVQRYLPKSFQVYEEEDFIVLRCLKCNWTIRFSAYGVDPGRILWEAYSHIHVG
jgi:aspartyl/asparaginyl beta-hydroxylase (cupin superfamily)